MESPGNFYRKNVALPAVAPVNGASVEYGNRMSRRSLPFVSGMDGTSWGKRRAGMGRELFDLLRRS